MSEKSSSAKPKKFKGWELLVAVALCVVVVVIFFSGFSGFDFGTSKKSASSDDLETYRKNLESKVKDVVGAIEGAGKVEVAITFDGTVEKVYAYETKTTSSGSVTEIGFCQRNARRHKRGASRSQGRGNSGGRSRQRGCKIEYFESGYRIA